MKKLWIIAAIAVFVVACKKDDDANDNVDNTGGGATYPGIAEYTNLDINNLYNYANPTFPVHYDADVLANDNTPANNPVTNMGATLGRVLFYDKQLSFNNTVACASCHIQAEGFVDPEILSKGFEGGLTGAHSMRVGNVRFYEGNSMFWDKRAASLEQQSTMPIQDATEMGFDASHGGIAALLDKMKGLPYYPELFKLAFGDEEITEQRMQWALAQFMRSMVSTNSKFDEGFAQVYNPNSPGPGNGMGQNFPNYTAQENEGKLLFLRPPNMGGAGCAGCHNVPTFSLAPGATSNGLDAGETTVFKSPSLKNIGVTGPYMHDGRFKTLLEVVEHYNSGVQTGPATDPRLTPAGVPQQLNLTTDEKNALVAFLMTLDDNTLNTDPKFSDPFVK